MYDGSCIIYVDHRALFAYEVTCN